MSNNPMPALFDNKGVFVPLDDAIVAAMPKDIRVAYDDVKQCAEASVAADAEVAAANIAIKTAMDDLRDAEKRAPKGPSRIDLVKEMIRMNS